MIVPFIYIDYLLDTLGLAIIVLQLGISWINLMQQ